MEVSNMKGASHHAALTTLLVFSIVGVTLYAKGVQEPDANGTRMFYIDSRFGSDNARGSSPAKAWRSLNRVNCMVFQPGDTISFAAGSIFVGELELRSSGTSSQPIIVTSHGSGVLPVFRNPDQYYSEAIDVRGSHIIIENVSVVQAHEAGIMINPEASSVTVRGCEIANSGTGVYVAGPDATILDSYIHDLRMIVSSEEPDNDDYGAVAVWIEAPGTVVSGNRFERCSAKSFDYGSDGGAIEIYGVGDGASIHHNIAIDCNGFIEAGGQPGSVANVIVAYNLVYNCGTLACLHTWGGDNTDPLFVENLRFVHNTVVNEMMSFFLDPNQGNRGVTIMDNIFVGAGDSSFCGRERGLIHRSNLYYGFLWLGFDLETDEILADPRFVDAGGDFRPVASSPVFDRAITAGFARDLAGQTVPFPAGGKSDIGAYECLTTAGANRAEPLDEPLGVAEPETASEEAAVADPPILFAHYPLEESDLSDHSGSGYDLIAEYGARIVTDPQRGWVGEVHQTPRGNPGGARFTMDTRTDPAAGGSMSIALWVRHFGGSGRWEGLIGKSSNWLDKGWVIQLREDDSRVMFQGSNPGGGLSVETDISPPQGEWSHWAFTYSNGAITIYYNGRPVQSGTIPPILPSAGSDARIVIGSAEDANNFLNFNGLIDDVRLYLGVLSDESILELYSATQ